MGVCRRGSIRIVIPDSVVLPGSLADLSDKAAILSRITATPHDLMRDACGKETIARLPTVALSVARPRGCNALCLDGVF